MKNGIGMIMVGCGGAQMQAFCFFCLKITVGCLTSTYPSVRLSAGGDILMITVSGPTCTNPSIRLSLINSREDDKGQTN